MLEYALKADKTTVVRDIRHELLTLGVTFMLKTFTDIFTAIWDIQQIPDDW